MSDKVALLVDREELIRQRDELEAALIDQGIALTEAREVARSLLTHLERYLKLNALAPIRLHEEAAAARAKIAGWEEQQG